MKRKDFIKKTAGALLLAIPAYAMLSCSKSDDSNPEPPQQNDANCSSNGTASSISSNHGHTITVSASDVSAGVEKTYNIQGSSAHSHSVTVTAANFASLANNQPVSVNSSSDNGHTHSINVQCA